MFEHVWLAGASSRETELFEAGNAVENRRDRNFKTGTIESCKRDVEDSEHRR
jgi:hypothetical protein